MSNLSDLRRTLEERAVRETMETIAASEVGREALEAGDLATLGELYIEAQNGATPEDLDARPKLELPEPLKPENLARQVARPHTPLENGKQPSKNGHRTTEARHDDEAPKGEPAKSTDTAYHAPPEDLARPLVIPNTNTHKPPPFMDLQRRPEDRWPT